MAALEEEGFITQPHTSAGRVPTEKGYQYYIQHFLEKRQLDKQQQQVIDAAVQRRKAQEQRAKQIAKALSVVSGEAVIISVGDNEYYATGLSNLFNKPEFQEHADLMALVGELFDQVDDIMVDMNRRVAGVEVLIGHENPFSEMMSLVVNDYGAGRRSTTVGILGPMRMDYHTNIALLEYIDSLMDNDYERTR